ncbi:MAG: hypothetical protein CMI30_05760 [Opitutae bacterium]|nr:hypothetical protein [Opitutae bacterium]|tara:strand:+ start:182 stop:841 length:660 start_codon:yes stop_codon:yes gene_type:complete
MMGWEFMVSVLAGWLMIYGLLALVIMTVCFFMARNDEKRTGITTLSGKSSIYFSLMNQSWWIVFIGITLVLVTMVLPAPEIYDEERDRFKKGKKDWQPLRIGIVLTIVGTGAATALGAIWQRCSGQPRILPRDNMFVKCYSGLNAFMLFSIVVSLVTFLGFCFAELFFDKKADWDDWEDAVKIAAMALVSSTLFLMANLSVFNASSDSVVKFPRDLAKE